MATLSAVLFAGVDRRQTTDDRDRTTGTGRRGTDDGGQTTDNGGSMAHCRKGRTLFQDMDNENLLRIAKKISGEL